MTIRTIDGRVIILNDSVELVRQDETIDGEALFTMYLVNINDNTKKVLVHKTSDEETQWNVYCQAVGLLRSRNANLLDFEAMDTNPDKDKYNNDTIEWDKKSKSTRRKNIFKKY